MSRWPGSTHDSTIFTHSTLYQRLQNREFGEDVAVLTDSAYSPEQYVCKPLPNPTTDAEKAYQYSQIHTRNVVERTIGVLKQRFQCLLIGSSFKKPHHLQDVILSCCILHNMIIEAEETAVECSAAQIEFQRNIGAQYTLSREARIQNFLINNYFH